MLRAQIVGATGYGGLGMVELMLGHPDWEIVSTVARGEAGRRLDDLYPHLTGRCDLAVDSVETTPIGEDCDVVVFATPDGVAQRYAADLHARGVRFIDYSGDFRFASVDEYARYAARHPSAKADGHAAATLLGASVYGIPELHREAIADAPVVGNPGCFAVGIVLGLAPLFQDGLIDGGQIHVDGPFPGTLFQK